VGDDDHRHAERVIATPAVRDLERATAVDDHAEAARVAIAVLGRPARGLGLAVPGEDAVDAVLAIGRERANIPPAPSTPPPGTGVSIMQAARELGVSTMTIRRWLAEGLLPAEQTAEHAPWRIRLTDDVRERFVPTVPDGYVKLDEAARQLGVAKQTVLNQVRAGRRRAVEVVDGKRRGLRIEILANEQGLLIQANDVAKGC